jgi:hypothetical protein
MLLPYHLKMAEIFGRSHIAFSMYCLTALMLRYRCLISTDTLFEIIYGIDLLIHEKAITVQFEPNIAGSNRRMEKYYNGKGYNLRDSLRFSLQHCS